MKSLVAEGGECLLYVATLWGDAYRAKNPGLSVDVRVEAEAKAIQDLTENSIQMALMVRDPSKEELAAFAAIWGNPPTRVAVAMAALVVLVNMDNPIKAIRAEQAGAFFSEDRPGAATVGPLSWGGCRRPISRLGR